MLNLESEAKLRTVHGEFIVRAYKFHNDLAVALICGIENCPQKPIIRVQSSCLFGESFSSVDCDCSWQVHHSLDRIGRHGCGVFVYLFQEGRGIGLVEKVRAYAIQQKFGCDTFEAFERLGYDSQDLRHYDAAVAILRDVGIKDGLLLTNNPAKAQAFESTDISLTPTTMLREPSDFKDLVRFVGAENNTPLYEYLRTKIEKFRHTIHSAPLQALLRPRNKRGEK